MAKVSALIIWVTSGINFYDALPSNAKYFFCLFPNGGLTFALQVVFQFERSGKQFGFIIVFLFESILSYYFK